MVLFLLCAVSAVFYRSRRLFRSLAFFYLTCLLFFLGYFVYSWHPKADSVLFWYGLKQAGLVWMPFAFSWVGADLAGRRRGRLSAATLAFGLAYTLALLLIRDPAVLSPPSGDPSSVWPLRPESWLLRPVLYVYAMAAGVIYLYVVYCRWWSGAARPKFIIPLTLGVSIMLLSGVMDVLRSWGLPSIFNGPILWLGTIAMSLGQAAAAAMQIQAMEFDLVRSEEKHRNILENMEEGYYEVDLHGNLTFFNDSLSRITGYPPQELMGLNNRVYMDEETAQRALKTFNRVLETGQAEEAFDWPLIQKDGGRRILEVSVGLIRDPQGEPVGYRGLARDITKRKQTEQELLNRSEQLRSLAVELARTEERERRHLAIDLHDGVGQYLAVCKLKLSRLQEKAGPPWDGRLGQVMELLETAIHDTRSLTSRLSPRVLHEIGLKAALEGLAQEKREHYGLDIQVEAGEDFPEPEEDLRAFIYRAVSELLHNTAKHARAKKALVSLRRNGDQYLVEVRDDGTGLEMESPGSAMDHGLGLFNLRERLEFMGGELILENPPQGGARVAMLLPLDGPDPKIS
jgi:PAS domain S-box-containing protein